MCISECSQSARESGFSEVREGVWESPISGLLYIERPIWTDDRGSYQEVCRIPDIEEILKLSFVTRQINCSRSLPRVVRGIHAEGWNKLVYVATGNAFCAWVDLRQESETFLQISSLVLGSSTGAVFVPVGVGNSFGVVGDEVVNYIYAVDETYDQRNPYWDDIALNPFDPDLGIPWPIENPILSERDRGSLSLSELLERMATL